MYDCLASVPAFDAANLNLLLHALGDRSFSGGHLIRTCAVQPGGKIRHFDFLKHLTQFGHTR